MVLHEQHVLHVSDLWRTLAVLQLQGKTDARFVEAAFKIFRDKFGLRPVITAAQFLEQASPASELQCRCATLHTMLSLHATHFTTCRDLLSGSLC